jgi:hypothetical protein
MAKHTTFTFLNAVVAMGFVSLSVHVFSTAAFTADRNDAVLYLGVATWFGLISFGHAIKNRALVAVTSAVVILASLCFMFLLLFAPLAWGDSNMPMIYMLQATLLLIIALQIAGLIALFASSGERKA